MKHHLNIAALVTCSLAVGLAIAQAFAQDQGPSQRGPSNHPEAAERARGAMRSSLPPRSHTRGPSRYGQPKQAEVDRSAGGAAGETLRSRIHSKASSRSGPPKPESGKRAEAIRGTLLSLSGDRATVRLANGTVKTYAVSSTAILNSLIGKPIVFKISGDTLILVSTH